MKQKLFNIYFFLFFFLMINREFVPFGMDLRMIGFGLGGILLFWSGFDIISKKERLKLETVDFFIVAFFILSFLSNIIWFYNGLSIHFDQFVVIFVSYTFNFMSYLIFRMNPKFIHIKMFKNAMMGSMIVLMTSIFMAYLGIDIQKYLCSGYQGFVNDLAPNFLGGMYRYGGLAEDPNYASLFLVFSFATHIYAQRKLEKRINIAYLFALLVCFLLAASKTTLIAIVPALFLMLLKDGKISRLIKTIWMPLMILVPIIFILSKIPLFEGMVTMTQRFTMWEYAIDLFKQSPIIGNGFTAFRSYVVTVGWWYVQCHSTIFQMLSETGIISLILLGVIFTLSLLKNNKYLTFMVTLFSVYMITTETAYHVYFVFVFAILPIIVEECELWKKQLSS